MAMSARGYPASGYRSGSKSYGGFQKPGDAPAPRTPPANDNAGPPPSPANDNYAGSPRVPFDFPSPARKSNPLGNPRGWLPGGGLDVLGDVSNFWEVYRNSNEFQGWDMAGYTQLCFKQNGGVPTTYGDYCQLSFLLELDGFVLPPYGAGDSELYFTEDLGDWAADHAYTFFKTRSQWHRDTAVGPLMPTVAAWHIPSTRAPEYDALANPDAVASPTGANEPGLDPRTDRGYARAEAYAPNYPSYVPNPGRAWDRQFANVPGLTFSFDNLAGPSAPPKSTPGSKSPPEPPSKDEKERKTKLVPGGSGAFGKSARRILNWFTESTDVLDALWQALPESIRGKKNKRLTAKAMDVKNNWDKIDVADALLGIAKNHFEDKVIGTMGSQASKGFGAAQGRYFGKSGRSVGITTGPAI